MAACWHKARCTASVTRAPQTRGAEAPCFPGLCPHLKGQLQGRHRAGAAGPVLARPVGWRAQHAPFLLLCSRSVGPTLIVAASFNRGFLFSPQSVGCGPLSRTTLNKSDPPGGLAGWVCILATSLLQASVSTLARGGGQHQHGRVCKQWNE